MMCLIDDFLLLDSEVEISETITELDILDLVKNKNNTTMKCDGDKDDEDGNDRDEEINKPSYDIILNSFETNRCRLQVEDYMTEASIGALQRYETYYDNKQFLNKKLKSNYEFFSN